MTDDATDVLKLLSEKGHRAKIVSINRLGELREGIESPRPDARTPLPYGET